ncbi:MAG: lipoprotein-releasing system ATP-binding protein LolD [Thermodesulfobacterium geofontis]|uniref:Lipoprotein-releasing system ATP-binding protein LolD n=2 Tax=Thermodesulfobacterium geofontis TaxID=1295609 RepID=A0A2N7PQA4_9BACT|nr:MAG: lipoprotein-releasing system ATP-binding protein LolD [Thermodesulfobacterium geofontis]
MEENNIIVELRDIKKKYFYPQGELEVLKGINLKVQKGDKIAVVGPSGVGKTTLLNIIGTLDYPTSGEIYFFGKKLDYNNEEILLKLRREHIGFIFQLHYLIPEFTVIENIILPGLISQWKKENCLKRAYELLEKLSLSGKENHKPFRLSGGERQKVAIARALFLNPTLLLADEPTGNLDQESAKEVVEIFLKINEEFGVTIIMVTHNWELAKKMDKIFLLKKGFLVKLENT